MLEQTLVSLQDALEQVEDLLENPVASLERIGRPVIGWFCSYTPEEIILASELHPYRVLPHPSQAPTLADSCLGSSFCPYARASLGEALQGNYDFLDGLVIVNSCDAMRRLYDAWRHYIGDDFVYLLDVPRLNSEAAAKRYREELERFGEALASHFGTQMQDDSLVSAIDLCNQVRSSLRELYEANHAAGSPLPASHLHNIVQASSLLPRGDYLALLENLVSQVRDSDEATGQLPRILVSGAVMDNPQVLDIFLEHGAKVVCDDLCTGTRYFWYQVEPESDPLLALSRSSLERIPCPRMKDSERRFDHLLELVSQFQVDGVVLYTQKFCDPFLFDIPVMRKELEKRDIPCLILESEFTPGTMERERTRIQAFIEMLEESR
ncbi:MAG: 2-hydroxyacyl-CoA dehydratase subunit D [Dehalococcoidia bacterium]